MGVDSEEFLNTGRTGGNAVGIGLCVEKIEETIPLLAEMVTAGKHYSDTRLETSVDQLMDSMSIMMALLQLALHCGHMHVKQRLTALLDQCSARFHLLKLRGTAATSAP